MIPYYPFKMTDRKARHAYYAAQASCLLPICILSSLGWARPGPLTPGIAGSIGILSGLFLILIGAYGLRRETGKMTSWGQRLSGDMDNWFPLLVFVVQNTSLIIVLTALWFIVLELGLKASVLQTVSLLSVFALVPLKRLIDAYAHIKGSLRGEMFADSLIFPAIMMTVIFLVTSLAQWMTGAYRDIPGQSTEISAPPFLLIWVPTILTAVTCLSAFVIRFTKALRYKDAVQPDEEPAQETTVHERF